jgi:hypothetical protein
MQRYYISIRIKALEHRTLQEEVRCRCREMKSEVEGSVMGRGCCSDGRLLRKKDR